MKNIPPNRRFPIPPNRMLRRKPLDKGQWGSIVSYVSSLTDVQKGMCVGCGKGRLFDKKSKGYLITRANTLEEVKSIVEEIRKINLA